MVSSLSHRTLAGYIELIPKVSARGNRVRRVARKIISSLNPAVYYGDEMEKISYDLSRDWRVRARSTCDLCEYQTEVPAYLIRRTAPPIKIFSDIYIASTCLLSPSLPLSLLLFHLYARVESRHLRFSIDSLVKC